jgi:glycosyltransferase involved in cell wall biosynthesis
MNPGSHSGALTARETVFVTIMPAPIVSVIVPTHNRAHLLPDTLRSIRQAGSDLEIVVVDDASSDQTATVCATEADVRYLRLARNSGTAHARNVGIQQSTAEFVAFVDDDDMRLPGSIDRQIERLRAFSDAALVHGQALVGDSRHSLPTGLVVPEICAEGDLFWAMIEANTIITCTVIARKRFLEEIGGFDTSLRTMEDYDLWVRLAENHPVVALAEPVAIYRSRSITSEQKTSDRLAHGRDRQLLLQKLLSTRRARSAPRRERKRAFRRHMNVVYYSLVQDAAEAFMDGEAATAKAYLKEAVCLNPLHVRAHASLLSLFCRTVAEKLSS